MTKPTPAQVKAAVAAYHSPWGGDTVDDRMQRALTAAAEVEQMRYSRRASEVGFQPMKEEKLTTLQDMFRKSDDEIARLKAQIADLTAAPMTPDNTAAAEVGQLPAVNWKDGKAYSYCPECGRQDNYLDARTIERCAQVAQSMYGAEGEEIATAIRALKDKP